MQYIQIVDSMPDYHFFRWSFGKFKRTIFDVFAALLRNFCEIKEVILSFLKVIRCYILFVLHSCISCEKIVHYPQQEVSFMMLSLLQTKETVSAAKIVYFCHKFFMETFFLQYAMLEPYMHTSMGV